MTVGPLYWNFGRDDPKRRGKWTVRLADESDLEGPLLIEPADGRGGVMMMSQDVYWQWRAAFSYEPMPYTGIDVVMLPPTLAHLRDR